MPAQLFPFLSHGSFDPDEILVMTGALEDAWRSLEDSGVDPQLEEEVQQMLAKFIVQIASSGEWDRVSLRNACLAYISQPHVT